MGVTNSGNTPSSGGTARRRVSCTCVPRRVRHRLHSSLPSPSPCLPGSGSCHMSETAARTPADTHTNAGHGTGHRSRYRTEVMVQVRGHGTSQLRSRYRSVGVTHGTNLDTSRPTQLNADANMYICSTQNVTLGQRPQRVEGKRIATEQHTRAYMVLTAYVLALLRNHHRSVTLFFYARLTGGGGERRCARSARHPEEPRKTNLTYWPDRLTGETTKRPCRRR